MSASNDHPHAPAAGPLSDATQAAEDRRPAAPPRPPRSVILPVRVEETDLGPVRARIPYRYGVWRSSGLASGRKM